MLGWLGQGLEKVFGLGINQRHDERVALRNFGAIGWFCFWRCLKIEDTEEICGQFGRLSMDRLCISRH